MMCPLQSRWTMVTSWSLDGSAQSEHEHRTVPGLRVLGLTLLTAGLHNTLRPVVFSRRVCQVWSSQVPVGWERGENKWSSSWGLVLLLLILVSALLVSTWIHIRRGHLSRSAAYFPSRGRACWVGGRRWRLSRRRQFPRKVSFYFFLGEKTLLFF